VTTTVYSSRPPSRSWLNERRWPRARASAWSSSGVGSPSAVPARGWRVEVEQAAGVEIEVDFRQGTRRVQVNLELEDGAVRERVRIRDEADGTDIRLENGVVVRTDPGDDRVSDDNSNSGPGSGAGHAGEDDSNRGPGASGHGADDPPGDDRGGRTGSDG
jgi:hypothetical protein